MSAYPELDHTHDPAARSWVTTANNVDCEFPIQNLPLGVFSVDGAAKRIGVAIGDCVLDLVSAKDIGLLDTAVAKTMLASDGLNELFAAGQEVNKDLRHAVFSLLHENDTHGAKQHANTLLYKQDKVIMHRPMRVKNYTDFYAGIHHAVRAGTLLQPDNPLPANYKWMPIGYHSRASTTHVSGAEIRRPKGQFLNLENSQIPDFGPCRELDLELEMAVYIGTPSQVGHPIKIEEAARYIAGYGLLNDWSARDVQKWEMKPLGPFLSKNLGTTLSPWVLTPFALAPFRVGMTPRSDSDPQPLPYLMSEEDQQEGIFDVALSVQLRTQRMKEEGEAAVTIIHSNMRDLYWTPQQLLTHHTCTGCDMETGDLIGTGTISGPKDDELGSLLELTMNGDKPVQLPNGEVRRYLEDGDEVTLRGYCSRSGFISIGFGAAVGTVLAAHS